MVTRCQSVYTQETAKSTHLHASAAEQQSDMTDRVGDPADEAWEDRSAIKDDRTINPKSKGRPPKEQDPRKRSSQSDEATPT